MIKYIQAFIFSVIASGCTYTYQPRPDTFKIRSITEFIAPVAISIINTQADTINSVHLYSGLPSIYGNMKAWTDTAVEITRRELTARKATVLGGKQRKLELSIIFIEGEIKGFNIRCITKLKVKTGSGYEHIYTGDNQSLATTWRAADGAVMRAVSAMLNDPVIVEYITSSKVLTKYEPRENNNSPFELLEKLKALFEKGILTEDEYTNKKGEIMQRIK